MLQLQDLEYSSTESSSYFKTVYPKGTIYERGVSKKHGEVFLHAPKKTKIVYGFLRSVGIALISLVILVIGFTYYPIVKEEITYKPAADPNLVIEAGNTSLIQNEAKNFGVDSYFSIVIPKISAHANIIANVDASNEKEYDEALQKGVAHAKGTSFPGEGSTIFLFAHSTNSLINVARLNAVFYLLPKLAKGDKILIYFADKRYIYEVSDIKTVGPTDTSFLNTKNGEQLILQTCTPVGTDWNRLLVIAKPVVDN